MSELTRIEALRSIDEVYPTDPMVLTLGTTVREMLLVTGEKPNHLPILDSMGLPAAIGLGLAQGLAEAAAHVEPHHLLEVGLHAAAGAVGRRRHRRRAGHEGSRGPCFVASEEVTMASGNFDPDKLAKTVHAGHSTLLREPGRGL
mgnify:CR=1 FL=1